MKQDTLEGKAKTKNGVKRLCFSIICILLEVIFIITIVTRLNEYAEIINLFTRILSGILVLGLYASNKTSSMKMPWVILILIFPIMGVGLYLLIGLNGGTHKMRERYAEIDSKLLPMLPDSQECLSRIKETIPKAGNIASYIQRNSQYPIYQNTDIVYFDEAVKGLEAQLKDLEKAQKFIFMEYHAIWKERRMELAFEGLRLFDIRRQIDPVTNQPVIAGLFGPNGSFVRYNMYESTDQYETSNLKELQNKGINFDINKHLVWPIPQSEIDRSFGTVTQNPNY